MNLRRPPSSFQLLVTAWLILLCAFSLQLQGQVTYSDTFSSVSYTNNDGTGSFSAGWIETGETTSPSSGRILINSNQLRFRNMDTRTISRTLDLSAAVSGTLTLDYNRTNGNESILVQLWDGSTWNTRATLAGTGSVNYTLVAADMSAASAIRFISGSGGWGSSETIFVDNVLFTVTVAPSITIDNVSVSENAGTATFTATHVGVSTGGPFTVNYQTVDGTATAGTDYTAIVGGTMNFNGTVGDTETIVVSITDDSFFEANETYSIQMTGSSDPSVIITDTGDGTIVDDEVVLGNTPLALFREFDGYMDYTSTSGTLRTQPNTINSCAITTSSSNTLSTAIPAGATIEAAYLYWAHSGANMDSQVTFEGNTVNGQVGYTTSIIGLSFYGFFSDVTSIITAIPDPTTNVYDFSGLTIDNTGSYCSSGVTLGGWSLIIFYSDTSLPASTINLYQGFDGNQFSSSTFSLTGFYAIGSAGSKTTALSWEGDQTLANSESLQFTTPLSGTNNLQGDGDNVGATNNPFNSTHYDGTAAPVLNNTTNYGVDLDTYDVSSYILPGENSATTTVNVGQDYVIMNAVLLKVPSNLITGRVFEDVNYGGGSGRNYAAASGVGVPGATVELWDSGGVLVDTQTTDAGGIYVFAGMIDGTYTVRVVNGSVASTRPGGSGCGSCMPVQTFKTEYIASTLVERTNEVGGTDPTATDPSAGTLTGAQSVAAVTISSEGVAGLDFGFNFNTIVNTNESGQGSIEQFIVNSNDIGEAGLDIEANAIFDPAAGEDTSVFMIPPTGDALGRTADPNYSGGIFTVSISNGSPLSPISGTNTHIDGRTQTAYSGDSNSGTVGSGGTNVGISATALPNFDRPELQLYRPNGDVIENQGTNTTIRNLSIYANGNAGLLATSGSITVSNSLLGTNAVGSNGGNIEYGVEVNGGTITIDSNYIATNINAGIRVDGGTSTIIQHNHITSNGNGPCDDNIELVSGNGIVIQQNLIELAQGLGIEGDGFAGGVTITENSITSSGQDGGVCSSDIENAGIRLHGDNSTISNNLIFSNGGPGIVLAGGDTAGNLISQNSIYANGTSADALGIDIDNSNAMGDGVTLNENGDTDNGPNGSLNFPIITSVFMSGTNVVIKGWSRPGTTVEFFLTDINEGTATLGDNQLGLSTDYGEGQVFLGSAIEGSASDTDGGTSSYTDADGNTDNTNQFEFSIPVPSGTAVGEYITATATLSNSTSEFSPFSIIKVRTVITNRRITYRVNN